MQMTVTLTVTSDDGEITESSVNRIGVDTRIPGIDPDSAKEDFMAQARGLLTAVGETHAPALYAAVQDRVEKAEACREEAESRREEQKAKPKKGKAA